MQGNLLLSGALTLPVAALYAYAGYRLGQRRVSPEAQEVVHLFSVWWFAVAGSTLISALRLFLGGVGVTPLGVFTTLTYLNFLLIVVGLCTLLYYLIYLYTGSTRSLPVLGGFYLIYFLALVYAIGASNPVGVEVTGWRVSLDYGSQITGPFAQILLALLFVPQILAAVAYLSIAFRVHNRTQRYRVLLVSCSILLWFSSSLGATLSGVSQAAWWPLASKAIGIAAAGAILLAYLPPAWIQDRLGVRRLSATGEGALRH